MVKVQRLIDRYIGFVLILFLLLFRVFDRKPKQYKKFLLIKLWAIGDSILSLSIIRGIRENIPGAAVDVLVRNRVLDIFNAYPVDDIINLDTPAGRKKLFRSLREYDVVFDGEVYLNISAILAFFLGKERIGFSDQWRSHLYTQATPFRKDQHMIRNYMDLLRMAGVTFTPTRLEKPETSSVSRDRVQQFIKTRRKRRFLIAITPGVAESSRNRMWFEERFAQAADRIIREMDADVVMTDHRSNRLVVDAIRKQMQEEAIDACGEFSLPELFALLEICDGFIGNDTGPMHVAAAMGCPTVGLFGPNTPVLWGPFGEGNVALYKTSLPPAIQNDKGIFREGNREEYMGPILVEDVVEAVRRCLLISQKRTK